MHTTQADSAPSSLVRQRTPAADSLSQATTRPDLTIAYVGSDVCCAWCGTSLLVLQRRPGAIAATENPTTGFFYREARHLSTLRFEVNGSLPWFCEAAQHDTRRLTLSYVHPEFAEFGGGGTGQARDERSRDATGLPHRSLEIEIQHLVAPNRLEVSATITNRWFEDVVFEASWALDADFADLLSATSPAPESRAASRAIATAAGLRLESTQDDYATDIAIEASGQWQVDEKRIIAVMRLAPQRTGRLALTVRPRCALGMDDAEAATREAVWREWLDGLARIATPGNAAVERTIARHVNDFGSFALLEGERDEWLTLQAGVPMYPALFGRDVLTAGWQAALLDRGAALDAALTRLGRLQGTLDDPERDEEPGRIVQQVRLGPGARHGSPFGRYYGDYASPFMYVIALAHLYAWAGDEQQLRRHWDVARRILDWARERGDRDGDGYLEYLTSSSIGPTHQGWKDSGDAVVHRDGSLARTPAATCELQGYWYAAQQVMAVMSWALGERGEAAAYWESAQDLKDRFNRDWWDDAEELPALAMDADKQPVRAASSNAGHVLACGILDGERIPRVVGRLFQPDMFSGWGIRTLSSAHRAYDPLSYHRGSVWAVENATIAFGLRRFGFDARAIDLAKGLFDLAALYPDMRIPETVGGYSRIERATPGLYPRANAPQLWNASAVPLLVHVLAGLQPVAPLDLLVVDPALPSWLPEIVIRNMRIRGAALDIRFWRDKRGASHVDVLRKRGTIHVVRQPPIESQFADWRDRFTALVDRVLHH
ncbi:MAG: glycogen debranching N-terminal domain-containing protein [Gemmatimonadaceae bacterium]